jgi:uncharacterized protein
MKKSIFLFSIILCSAISGFAQPDAEYKSALQKMLAAAGTEQTFKVAIKQMFEMFKQQKTSVPNDIWVGLEAEFNASSMAELVDMLAPVYHRHISISDLQAITAFYETPVGKKYAEKTPFIMEESMQVGQQWGMKIAQRFQEKLKEKGY